MLSPVPSIDNLAVRDGTRLWIRPLAEADRDGFARLFDGLSPQSRYRRYLNLKPALTSRELSFLVGVDHRRHEALTAVDQRDGSLVGVARYVIYAEGPTVADVAVEVIDERQRLGIGQALAARLITRARQNRVEWLTGTVLWENRPARALFRRLGFRACGSSGAEIQLELGLGDDPSRPRKLPRPDGHPSYRRRAGPERTLTSVAR